MYIDQEICNNVLIPNCSEETLQLAVELWNRGFSWDIFRLGFWTWSKSVEWQCSLYRPARPIGVITGHANTEELAFLEAYMNMQFQKLEGIGTCG